MNKRGKLSVLAVGVLLGANLFAAKDLTTKQTLEGTVTPMVTMDYNYGLDQFYKGFIDYVMPAGTFFTGPVYDSHGICVKEGDILATINPEYAKLQNQADKLALDDAIDQYNRDKASEKAMTKRDMASHKIDVLEAQAKYDMSKKIVDEVCTLRARFDGYVNEVKFSGGWAQGLPATLNVSQLDPIYISIAIPRGTTTSTFNYNTPVTVYPNRSSGEPVGFIQGRTTYKNGTLMLLVNNKPLPPPVNLKDKDGKNISVIKMWCPVIQHGGLSGFAYDNNSMVVSKDSLFGTDGDYYVWMVDGAKSGIAGQGMNYINKVKKVKVETDGKLVSVPSYVRMISFTPKEKVETVAGTILLSNLDCPADLKDGDNICLFAGMYTFMPGETVKVDMGPTPATIQ